MNFVLPTDAATLQSMLVAAYTDVAYGCITRAGMMAMHTYSEGKSVIFLDVDAMHALNDKFGYAEVDRRIRESIGCRDSDIVAARWQSGDEIILVVDSADAKGLVKRLVRAFASHGMTAMYAVAPLSRDLEGSVLVASNAVQAQKRIRDAQNELHLLYVDYGVESGADLMG